MTLLVMLGAVILGWFYLGLRPGKKSSRQQMEALMHLSQRVKALEQHVRALEQVQVLRRKGKQAAEEIGKHSLKAAGEAANKVPTQAPSQARHQPAVATVNLATLNVEGSIPARQGQEAPKADRIPPRQPTVSHYEPDDVLLWPIHALRDWFTGGDTLTRIGVVVLFFGVAFLLKYSAEHTVLTIQWRLGMAGMMALGLLSLGWHLRDQRMIYAQLLQGAGIGVAYLAVFAAVRMYDLLPEIAAFVLLLLVCILAVILALAQAAPALAVMGSAGGFLAPLLMSSTDHHMAIFSYYALLNTGILTIAWFKAWRSLNLLGFVFTSLMGSFWGWNHYQVALRLSTEFFLILFFLMFVVVGLLYALHRQLSLKHYVDGTLIFGTPLTAMALQSRLLSDTEYGAAWSALALALFYLTLWACLADKRQVLAQLRQAMLCLAVMFATLAIPLAFDGRITTALWAIEGAALVWVSLYQRSLWALSSAILLQFLAGLAFTLFDGVPAEIFSPLMNSRFIGAILLACAGLFSGWLLQRRDIGKRWLSSSHFWSSVMACWGALWWAWGGITEIWLWHDGHHWSARALIHGLALWVLMSAWLAHAIRRLLCWPLAGVPASMVAPILAFLAMWTCLVDTASPLQAWAAPIWLLLLSASWTLIWRCHKASAPWTWHHTLLQWTLWMLIITEAYWRLPLWVPADAWRWCAWACVASMLLATLSNQHWQRYWFMKSCAEANMLWGALPSVVMLLGWTVGSLTQDGAVSALPYVPLFNPLDLTQLLVLLVLTRWARCLDDLTLIEPPVLAWGLPLVFAWLNAMLLRALHHWAGVDYTLYELSHSTLVQACLSVFWTVLALLAMTIATTRGLRVLWLGSSGLLAITIIKLFSVDLTFLAELERIGAFIVIGVLLLVIGYFCPLPPRKVH